MKMPADLTEYPHQFVRGSGEFEHPACPLCQARTSRFVVDGGDDWVTDGGAGSLRFSVVRCDGCGGCYTTPRYREEAKQRAFAGSYPFYQRARNRMGVLTDSELGAFAGRAGQVLRFQPHRGSILDLGMGDGAFLELMRRKGWRTAGVDCEPDVVAYACQYLGQDASLVSDVERDPLPGGPFDAVSMWGLLQLTYRPQQLLEKVRTILCPHGIVAIGVSNFGSVGARLFRSHWRGLGLPRHLIHFERESLRCLLERSGYEVLDIVFETPYWIVGLSVDGMMPIPGLPGKIIRRSAQLMLSVTGRTRFGDTMIAIARLAR